MRDRREYFRKYNKEWLKKRRQAWFQVSGPCVKCGSKDQLELDHIDPTTKTDHTIWSWSEIRRIEELKKCQVLCKKCHRLKSAREFHNQFKNKPKLEIGFSSEVSDLAMFLYVVKGISRRKIATLLGINQGTISKWIYGARGGEWLKRQAHGC